MKTFMRHLTRATWAAIGVVALTLGAIGLVLPLLPTTPFVLLAAFCFAKSSARLHRWLLEHRVFGPVIEDWRRYGVISRRGKILGVGSMVAVLLLSWVLGAATYVIAIQAVVLGLSASFVLSRPLPPDV